MVNGSDDFKGLDAKTGKMLLPIAGIQAFGAPGLGVIHVMTLFPVCFPRELLPDLAQ
jgi:hypothetical protein